MDERAPRPHLPVPGPPPCVQPLLSTAARRPDLFDRRVIRLAPGEERAFDPSEWADALVVLEAGALELEGQEGTRAEVGRGAVLWLAGLPLRALRNVGSDPAVIVAIARRDPVDSARTEPAPAD